MLHKNRRVLEKIVEELLEFEILTAKVKKSWFWIGTSLILTGTFTRPLLSNNFNLHLSMLIDLVVWYRQTTNDIYLLFNIEIHSSWCWQDLQRIFEDNGGVREKEPFFLSGSHDREVFLSVSTEWTICCYWCQNLNFLFAYCMKFYLSIL